MRVLESVRRVCVRVESARRNWKVLISAGRVYVRVKSAGRYWKVLEGMFEKD